MGYCCGHEKCIPLEHLFRGTVESELMLLHFRITDRRGKPPSFLQLLSEIRSEEECASSQSRLTSSVNRASIRVETESGTPYIQSL